MPLKNNLTPELISELKSSLTEGLDSAMQLIPREKSLHFSIYILLIERELFKSLDKRIGTLTKK
jgi:DUF1365 family protein